MPPEMGSEFQHLFELFRKCLELRDKYMAISLQRLGDNPRDYDGTFTGLEDSMADVSGIRPDADLLQSHQAPGIEQLKPWRIYPKPPPPHWHWTAKQEAVSSTIIPNADDHNEEFNFAACDIPGSHQWDFELDSKGVFQVYHNIEGRVFLWNVHEL